MKYAAKEEKRHNAGNDEGEGPCRGTLFSAARVHIRAGNRHSHGLMSVRASDDELTHRPKTRQSHSVTGAVLVQPPSRVNRVDAYTHTRVYAVPEYACEAVFDVHRSCRLDPEKRAEERRGEARMSGAMGRVFGRCMRRSKTKRGGSGEGEVRKQRREAERTAQPAARKRAPNNTQVWVCGCEIPHKRAQNRR